MKTTASLFSMSLLLAGCQTAPIAPTIVQTCPKIPTLELSLPTDALERPFFGPMQNFLQGKLDGPISYDLRSKPASPTPLKLNAN